MLENSWSTKLSQQPKYTAICSVPQPSIIYQNVSNQLMVHTNSQTISLPLRKEILGLNVLPSNQILILSRYQLSCFDILNNNQVFGLQFENASKLFVSENHLYVASNSDLFCYSLSGEEEYVNQFSNGIETLMEVVNKGNTEIIIGLNDMTMYRYKGVNISFQYGKIIGIPVSICSIENQVVVGIEEGTIALYESKKSKWKAKSTHPVFKIIAHRTESQHLLIIARKDGLIELKDWKNKGQTTFKIKTGEDLVGMHIYDFRKEDNQQLMCICKSGTVKALNIHEEIKKEVKAVFADEIKNQNQKIENLLKEKTDLEYEILQLKQNLAESELTNDQNQSPETILNPQFKYQSLLKHDKQGLCLTITCFGGYISGIVFEESIQPVEVEKTTELKYVFSGKNLVVGEVNCLLIVHSSFTAKIYEALSLQITLTKFWKWQFVTTSQAKIETKLKFNFVERNARYIKWIHQCFFVFFTEEETAKFEAASTLKLRFRNIYENIQMEFVFASKEGKVQIYCDCLKTLGEIFQDLMEYVGAVELDSELYFPSQKEKIKDLLNTIEKMSQNKISISSEMTEAIDNIKFLLVKGESARAVGCIKEFRKSYTDVMVHNRNLLIEIEKKNQNTKQLSESLKMLSHLINQTSNVRCGKAKEAVVIYCREAIKKKQFPKIISIMQRGLAGV